MNRIALFAALSLALTSTAHAAGGPGYTYTISGTGTGSVAGIAFNALPLTLSFTDSTPGTITSAGVNVYDTAPAPALSFLWDATAGNFNENALLRDNQNIPLLALRLGNTFNSATSGLDIRDAFFGTYRLDGPAFVTPIATTTFLDMNSLATSAGAFTLTGLSDITFTAGVVAVPEVGNVTFVLPALCMVGAMILRRRRN